MRTTESTAAIRKSLKAAGFSSRDVSVRAESYSMGATIHVVIRNADVPMALVQSVAAAHEHVRRDEGTGEILSGGNTFMEIKYARELMNTLRAPIVEQISDEPGEVRTVAGWTVFRTTEPGGHYYSASRPGCRQIHCWGREFCAEQIVTENLKQDHKPRVHVKADCVEVSA